MHHYMSNFSSIMHRLQKPMQEIMVLNAHTLRKLKYFTPEELTQIHAPEDLIDKQVDFFISNGHRWLDYMQDSFLILEKNFLFISDEVKQQNKRAYSHMNEALSKNIRKFNK